MSDVNQPHQSLDIGKVIQETFAVFGRQFSTFILLAVILVGAPTAVFGLLTQAVLGDAVARNPFALGPGLSWVLLGFLVTIATSTILQATVIYGAASDLNERPFSLTDCLRVGLRAFLPLVGLGIMIGVAVIIGCLLLIVPGVLLALAWCVAVPAYVVEQIGVFDAFGRSAELTRDNRLRIFALGVLWVVGSFIINLVIGAVGGVLSFLSFGFFRIVQAALVQPLISVIVALLGATLSAVLYVELRRIREGVGPQGLAAIFD